MAAQAAIFSSRAGWRSVRRGGGARADQGALRAAASPSKQALIII
jgi:hypothetical protein